MAFAFSWYWGGSLGLGMRVNSRTSLLSDEKCFSSEIRSVTTSFTLLLRLVKSFPPSRISTSLWCDATSGVFSMIFLAFWAVLPPLKLTSRPGRDENLGRMWVGISWLPCDDVKRNAAMADANFLNGKIFVLPVLYIPMMYSDWSAESCLSRGSASVRLQCGWRSLRISFINVLLLPTFPVWPDDHLLACPSVPLFGQRISFMQVHSAEKNTVHRPQWSRASASAHKMRVHLTIGLAGLACEVWSYSVSSHQGSHTGLQNGWLMTEGPAPASKWLSEPAHGGPEPASK